MGTVKTQVTTTGFQLEAATLVVALVAAAGSLLSFIFAKKMSAPAPAAHSNTGMPPADAPEQVTETYQTTATGTTTGSAQLTTVARANNARD